MTLRYAKQLDSNNRVKIIEAVELIALRYERGELYTSVMMPPRYGKSSVIRLSALELRAKNALPSVMIAPWRDNVDQIREHDSINDMYQRYGIESGVPFVSHRAYYMQTNTWWKTDSGIIPTLITCTIGKVQDKSSQQQFLDGVADMYQRFGMRVPVFVDEAHLVKTAQEWGKFIGRISDSGGYIIPLTGTPVPGIPGFQQTVGEWEDAIRYMSRKRIVDGEIKNFLETHEGEERSIKNVTADINVSWKEAWDVKSFAGVDAVWIDIEVIDKETKESLGMLSKLPKAELNGRLRSIEESEEMICTKADNGIDRLLQMRSREKTKNAQMLVVTGSDWNAKSDGHNIHAQAYRKALQDSIVARGLDLDTYRIEIATGIGNDGEPNKKSANLIKEFRKGKIDILIVKLMGIVGLDVAPCKVLVFGSTLRNGPMAVQALTRVLTKWGQCRANMILSLDKAMVDLYDCITEYQPIEQTESNLQLVSSIEIPLPEERPLWGFQNAQIHSYGDEKGEITIGDFELELRIIKNKYHTDGLSDRQIIENFQSGGFPISPDDSEREEQARRKAESSGIVDLDAELENIKGKFGRKALAIVFKYVPKTSPEFEWKVAELQSKAKEICGIPKYIRVPKIDDAALLQRLINALPQAEPLVFGNEQARKSV
jgi:hypothetical protein